MMISLPLLVVSASEKGLSRPALCGTTGEKLHVSLFTVRVQTIPSDDPQDDDEVVTEVAAKADHDYAVTPLPGMFMHF